MTINTKPPITYTQKTRVKAPLNGFVCIAILMVILSVAMSIKPLYLLSKAALAQYLLQGSWQLIQQQTLQKTRLNQVELQQIVQIPPWPWADTYPIAKLSLVMNTSLKPMNKNEDILMTNTQLNNTQVNNNEINALDVNNIHINNTQLKPVISWIILAGMTGRTMAFGPGWLEHSAKPNHVGNTIISAHNDSHFAILENVNIGDTFVLEDQHSRKQVYQIHSMKIVDESDSSVYQYSERKMLTLITCYPFTITNSNKNKRLVVTAIAT